MKAFVLIVVIVAVIFGLGFMFIPNIAIMPYVSTLDTTGHSWRATSARRCLAWV